METDSDFLEKRKKADQVYEHTTGISYWMNPDMNAQLRNLMDCMLNICPDVNTYREHLQDNLISLWEDHDALSVMSGLLKMAEDPILINDENRHDANVLMNQIAYLALGEKAVNVPAAMQGCLDLTPEEIVQLKTILDKALARMEE